MEEAFPPSCKQSLIKGTKMDVSATLSNLDLNETRGARD
jgi:hypothetical protein